jgi:hypothetical protein
MQRARPAGGACLVARALGRSAVSRNSVRRARPLRLSRICGARRHVLLHRHGIAPKTRPLLRRSLREHCLDVLDDIVQLFVGLALAVNPRVIQLAVDLFAFWRAVVHCDFEGARAARSLRPLDRDLASKLVLEKRFEREGKLLVASSASVKDVHTERHGRVVGGS